MSLPPRPATFRAALRTALVAAVVAGGALAAAAQTHQAAPGDPLYQAVVDLDRRVFEAYNTCDLPSFATFFAEDVEFYHDQGGVTQGRRALVASIEKNICGKTRRDPVPGTLEVHPMKGYGALQVGSHWFCDVGRARCDGTTGGVGKYANLWRQSDGQWQITRVYSYDHEPVNRQGRR
jgi:ketosteroid isomerase-like protein